jgi:hypothetical protein
MTNGRPDARDLEPLVGPWNVEAEFPALGVVGDRRTGHGAHSST